MNTITCSPLGIEKMKEILIKHPCHGIRLGLRSGGCMGHYVVMELVEVPNKNDSVFHFDTVYLYIDSKSLVLLNKTDIDYETTLMRRGFVFNIPNQKEQCSCKESVSF